jgi:hypothetical protein
MFKKSDGKLGFGIGRMFMNSFSSVAHGLKDRDEVDVSPEAQDLIFVHQMGEPQPTVLSPKAFIIGNIVGNCISSVSTELTLCSEQFGRKRTDQRSHEMWRTLCFRRGRHYKDHQQISTPSKPFIWTWCTIPGRSAILVGRRSGPASPV